MKPLAFLFVFGLIASPGRVITFDAAPAGKVPPGWSVAMTNRGAAPKWEIRRDQSAPTQPHVLAQVSSQRDGGRFPLAIFDGAQLRDGDVSVRMKPVAGKEVLAGGVVFRYRDENNYYLARANVREQNVAIFKVEDGQRIPITDPVSYPLTANTWKIMKISLRGSRIQLYMSHRRIIETRDSTFSEPGKVGLWTVSDSVTYFDDFRVKPK